MIARALASIVALGIVLAGTILWRISSDRRVRAVIAVLAGYGVAAFAYAAAVGIGLADTLAGRGLFAPLPYALQGAFVGAFIVLPIAWAVSLVGAGVPRFRKVSHRRALHQAVALSTCLALVSTSVPYGARGADRSRQTTSARLALLDTSLGAFEAQERNSPRDRWDPDDVVHNVGRDPQRLFAWVRNNTYWIPYLGALRGPVGVLMDRQGNSLDRAILLATLLQKGGYRVRLAHGELTRQQALDLLPRLEAARDVALLSTVRGAIEFGGTAFGGGAIRREQHTGRRRRIARTGVLPDCIRTAVSSIRSNRPPAAHGSPRRRRIRWSIRRGVGRAWRPLVDAVPKRVALDQSRSPHQTAGHRRGCAARDVPAQEPAR